MTLLTLASEINISSTKLARKLTTLFVERISYKKANTSLTDLTRILTQLHFHFNANNSLRNSKTNMTKIARRFYDRRLNRVIVDQP